MTTREAIAIVRSYVQSVNCWNYLREALLLVATIAEHHADRNRKNKRRQREKETGNGNAD